MIIPSLFKFCPLCGKKITKFKDVLSEKEFEISGMCQDCQDSVFEEKKQDG